MIKAWMKKGIASTTLGASLLVGSVSFGAEYKIDSSHSNIEFVTRHFVSKVKGQFTDFNGELSFDPKKPTDSKVNAVVKVTSVNTSNQKRDAHLQSDDFFAAQKYPTFTFVSKKITADGKDAKGNAKYKMMGDLTMRGVTKPVTFDVEYLGEAKGMDGKPMVAFTASSKISRKDFGINWNKALDNGGFVLSDDVEINLNIEAGTKM
jgi:polyisoprenoid-binding protein YceI